MVKILLTKGRIQKQFVNKLIDKGLLTEDPFIDRKLFFENSKIGLYLVKSSDILSIFNYYGDLAIVGSDMLEENDYDYVELLDLKIGECSFMLAGKNSIDLNDIKKVATSYPKIAKQFLNELRINCEIIKLSGSLELYPNIGLVDGIIDIVETGETLRKNDLVVLDSYCCVSTRVIAKKETENQEEIKRLIKILK